MKSKSYILKNWRKVMNTTGFKYGELIFECYYKTDKKGNYSESSPNLSEFLFDVFKQVSKYLELDNDTKTFWLGAWDSGLYLEEFKDNKDTWTQRLIFRPSIVTCSEKLAKREFNRLKVQFLEEEKKRYLNSAPAY